MFAERMDRVCSAMGEANIDVLMLSVGPDMPWLVGYEAMPLERLTMLVVTRDGEATLVIPSFEVPRVVERPEVFTTQGWEETENPIDIVAGLASSAAKVAVGDHMWSRFLVDIQAAMPSASWQRATSVTGQLRAQKEASEIERLQAAASGVDRIAAALQGGEIPLIGRSEAEVSADLGRRILAEGHAVVNFAIVAAGENASSPHHHPGERIIQPGEVVLCDFGGTTTEPDGQPGYCSDITRCVYTGQPPEEFRVAYDSLQQAQELAVQAAVVGTAAETVDKVARDRLAEDDLDQWFLHRLGHGIGVEAHEDPYLVAGNPEPLLAGNAFSIEPGFYVDGKWGARLEDIVVSTDSGPKRLNNADHGLAIVES